MRKFTLKSILLILLLGTIDCVAGIVFNYREYAKEGGLGKVAYLMSRCMEDDVLIMGSSRAAHHYVPQTFSDSLGLKSFNAGFDGNGIVLGSGLLKGVIRNHIPKIILYELTPSFDLIEGDDVKYLYLLRPYFDYPEIQQLVMEVSPIEHLKWYSSLYRLNSYLFTFLGNVARGNNNILDGYLPLSDTLDYVPKKQAPLSQNIDPLKRKLLKELIKSADENGIDLVFTISPIFSYPDTASYDMIVREISDLGGTVFNHLNDSVFVGHNRYFSDRTHLNNIGAERYSKFILKELGPYLNESKERIIE